MRELLRLRWGPGRVGKLRALLLEVIASTGGATLLEISERTGRRRHNVRRALRLLEARALVECSEETYRLVPEFAAALDAELEASGVKLSERLDEQRYRRQQQAFRAAWEAGAVTKSRHRRFFREWESRNPKLEADGFIEELERVEADHDHDHDLVEDRAPTPQPTDSVITDASDPEQLRQLAALARERIAEHRRKHPPAKLPAPERAARLLRRLRDEDPNLLAALSADPRRLGREPWRRGWTEAVFPANTMTRALGLLEAEALAAEVGERVVA
jgi:predicted transcriptional regulator